MPPRTRKTAEPDTTPEALPEQEATPGEALPPLPESAYTPESQPLSLEVLPNVHQCIAKAMAAVRAVGKQGRNERDGYAFKRIDDFMTAANGAMAQAGVHQVPTVLQRITDESHTTRGGAVLRWVDLEVRFRFYGPAGDYVDAITWGEGRDSSDKATNKALTAAQKYALMYVLMVPTDDIQDADRDSPESQRGGASDPEQERLAREHAARVEAEKQAAAERRAQQIAAATADAETVARLRADVLGYADTITNAMARKEHLLATWNEGARLGALGCEVRLPEPWRAHTSGPEVCTLHELIAGAQDVTLPQSGEPVDAEVEDPPADPWATQPTGPEAQGVEA